MEVNARVRKVSGQYQGQTGTITEVKDDKIKVRLDTGEEPLIQSVNNYELLTAAAESISTMKEAQMSPPTKTPDRGIGGGGGQSADEKTKLNLVVPMISSDKNITKDKNDPGDL